ncbi:hypothetical protein K2O51_18825 [Cupriavidus pinatubonensis]|uniref:hypothetical protein n=1 Tax=Cupriavidus pinatubonensis TaxID=248026 RepID=UPI001125E540|nr:hypothetical protein [Cupriavidus pinatubonensis]QYY32802.1 hypothetical protein K2O51_18825 [Cupriavidus pinatubonensis]TPQ32455.1 hypothetical protein C2U69_26700 [Cupriavidus pinatubonensis]
MLATILSLAFVLSVLTTAISLDSHERRGNDASGPTEKQLHSVLKKCQPKQEPADAATGFAHGGIPHEHFATVVPFIEGYRDEGGCDALLNDEHKETGGVNASVSSSGQASHQRL